MAYFKTVIQKLCQDCSFPDLSMTENNNSRRGWYRVTRIHLQKIYTYGDGDDTRRALIFGPLLSTIHSN